MRVIDDEGKQVGVFPIREALRLAQERDVDLVEVAPAARPPVCRLLNYGKFLYERTKKEREALQWVLEADGVRPWKEFVGKYGDDEDETKSWNFDEPESIPGRLRLSGLLFSGKLNDQVVAFIPVDARPLLQKLLQ